MPQNEERKIDRKRVNLMIKRVRKRERRRVNQEKERIKEEE